MKAKTKSILFFVAAIVFLVGAIALSIYMRRRDKAKGSTDYKNSYLSLIALNYIAIVFLFAAWGALVQTAEKFDEEERRRRMRR